MFLVAKAEENTVIEFTMSKWLKTVIKWKTNILTASSHFSPGTIGRSEVDLHYTQPLEVSLILALKLSVNLFFFGHLSHSVFQPDWSLFCSSNGPAQSLSMSLAFPPPPWKACLQPPTCPSAPCSQHTQAPFREAFAVSFFERTTL